MSIGSIWKNWGKENGRGVPIGGIADYSSAPVMPVPMAGIIPRPQTPFPPPMPQQYMPYSADSSLFRAFGGYRAQGGRVRDDRAYIVGENGPEVFKPSTDGQIIPNPNTPPADSQLAGTPVNQPATPPVQPTGEQIGTQITPRPLLAMPAPPAGQPVAPDAPAPSAPNIARPTTSNDYAAAIQNLENNKRAEAAGQDYDGKERKHSLLGRLASGLWKGYKNWDGQGGLVGLGASVLEDGIGSAASPKFHQELRLQDQENQLFRGLQLAQQNEKFQTDQALTQAKTDEIPADAENTKLRIEEQKQAAADRLRSTALTKLSGLRYFDPTNAVHKQLARQAGLDADGLKGWDDRNPVEKQVAGRWYKLNRETGNYEPSNLPADEAKTLTDYTVEMPSGEKRTYRVSQKDAANFSTQMSSLGARIASAEKIAGQRLSLDQAKFDQAKSEFERVNRLRILAMQQKNSQQAQELGTKLAQMVQSAMKAHERGELSDEQYQGLMDAYGNQK